VDVPTRLASAAVAVAALLVGCEPPIRGATDQPATDEFEPAGCIDIVGYPDDAMEPFVTADGGALLFNNRNSPPERTDLHWAKRIDDAHFEYVGPITGANSPALDAVPSVDATGYLYFVSLRSYNASLSTLYRARWSQGRVTDVVMVRGVSRNERGMLNFDAAISRDGDTLFFVDGRFSGGAVPDSADIVIAQRQGDQFVRDVHSAELLATVNTGAREYAPAISADGLEFYFTRLDMTRCEVAIYRVTRMNDQAPFGAPVRIAAATGFVEAPALSGDGRTLYFHRLDDGKFHVCRAVRAARPMGKDG
jgi:hypothetical protein